MTLNDINNMLGCEFNSIEELREWWSELLTQTEGPVVDDRKSSKVAKLRPFIEPMLSENIN